MRGWGVNVKLPKKNEGKLSVEIIGNKVFFKKKINKPVASMTQTEKDELLELLRQHLLENTK